MASKPIKDERFTFETEWYDQQADIIRYYRLFYFPVNNCVEMYDKKMERIFLKKTEVSGLTLANLYVGNKVTVMSRVLHIVSYGDIATQRKQAADCQKTFAMIKPCSYQNIGKIIDAVQ